MQIGRRFELVISSGFHREGNKQVFARFDGHFILGVAGKSEIELFHREGERRFGRREQCIVHVRSHGACD